MEVATVVVEKDCRAKSTPILKNGTSQCNTLQYNTILCSKVV